VFASGLVTVENSDMVEDFAKVMENSSAQPDKQVWTDMMIVSNNILDKYLAEVSKEKGQKRERKLLFQ